MMMIAAAQMFVALLETSCLPGRRANGPLWFHSHGDLCARWTAATCLRVLSIESVRRICSGRFGCFFMQLCQKKMEQKMSFRQVKKLSRNTHAIIFSFFWLHIFFLTHCLLDLDPPFWRTPTFLAIFSLREEGVSESTGHRWMILETRQRHGGFLNLCSRLWCIGRLLSDTPPWKPKAGEPENGSPLRFQDFHLPCNSILGVQNVSFRGCIFLFFFGGYS